MKISKKDLKKLIVEEIKRSLFETEQKEAVEEIIKVAKEEAIKSADEDPQALQQKSDVAMAELPPEAQQVIQQMLDNIDSEMEKESGLRETLVWSENISSHPVIRKIADDITVPDPEIYKKVRRELIAHYLKKLSINTLVGTGTGASTGFFAGGIAGTAGVGSTVAMAMMPVAAVAGAALGAGLAARLMIKDAKKIEKEALWRTRKKDILKKFSASQLRSLPVDDRKLLRALHAGDWDSNWRTGDYQMDLYRKIFDEPE